MGYAFAQHKIERCRLRDTIALSTGGTNPDAIYDTVIKAMHEEEISISERTSETVSQHQVE